MDIDFKSLFQTEIDNPPPVGLIMKYNTLRVNKQLKKMIFVEGSSDSRFYSKTNIEELSDSVYYIYQSYKDGNGGKEAVYYAYNKIKTNEDLHNDINRCVFIVDRDWELSIKSKNNLISSKDRDRFTLTQGHSMECYFLEDENISVVFKELDIEEHIGTFKDYLRDFKDKTHHYWALKGALQYASNHGIHVHYRKRHSFEEVFRFDFSRNEYFDISKMNEEIDNMENALKDEENLMNYCHKWDEKIDKEPRFIRGHDYFNLLYCFINQYCKKNISEWSLYKFVPEFKVTIEIKTN